MTLRPLLDASWAIQIHVVALLLAWLLGTWLVLLSRKGAAHHRMLGGAFIALMIFMALVTLFIRLLSPHSRFLGLSWLHLYVPLILILCAIAVYGAASGRRRLHRFAVISLYFGSLVFTGFVQVFLGSGLVHRIFFS